MINLLSYAGMPLQSELSLWSLMGLFTCIFDATLFKVNSNLKKVWQMKMPEELSLPLQHFFRSMISGVMLVQCFTVYVYLATYIVMMYPVFLEERPNLLLPWLLLAAIRKLLCELTSLTLGLTICVLLGPARSTCIKFVVTKTAVILPSFYMWILVYSYYRKLKISKPYLQLVSVRPKGNDVNYGLELAVRRRRTKSLLDEEQLRNTLIAHLSGEKQSASSIANIQRPDTKHSSICFEPLIEDDVEPKPTFYFSKSNESFFDDWLDEIIVPRDTDRVTEQFSIMLLRIAASRKHEPKTEEEQESVEKPEIPEITFESPLMVEEKESSKSDPFQSNHNQTAAVYSVETDGANKKKETAENYTVTTNIKIKDPDTKNN